MSQPADGLKDLSLDRASPRWVPSAQVIGHRTRLHEPAMARAVKSQAATVAHSGCARRSCPVKRVHRRGSRRLVPAKDVVKPTFYSQVSVQRRQRALDQVAMSIADSCPRWQTPGWGTADCKCFWHSPAKAVGMQHEVVVGNRFGRALGRLQLAEAVVEMQHEA